MTDAEIFAESYQKLQERNAMLDKQQKLQSAVLVKVCGDERLRSIVQVFESGDERRRETMFRMACALGRHSL